MDNDLSIKLYELLQQSFCTYDIFDLHSPLQEDDHNCGVWIVWLNSIWNRHITEQIHGVTSPHNTTLLRRIYESIISNRLISTRHYQHILDPSQSPKQRCTSLHTSEQHRTLLKTLLEENREHCEPNPRKNETRIHNLEENWTMDFVASPNKGTKLAPRRTLALVDQQNPQLKTR